MKDYLKAEIEACENTERGVGGVNRIDANYWRGKSDAFREVLRRVEAKGKPNNPGRLKVWGIMGFNAEGKQERCVVATRTKADAAKAFNCTAFHLGKYGAITGNPFEVKVALENPGKVIFVGGQ